MIMIMIMNLILIKYHKISIFSIINMILIIVDMYDTPCIMDAAFFPFKLMLCLQAAARHSWDLMAHS